jgi:hypothetical protein
MHPFIKDQNERLLHRAHEEINYALKSLPDSAPITFEEFTVLKDKVSRRKLLANRRNSKKSTGPKTEEGKKRSSKNAIQHGLTAQSDITSIMLEYDGEFNSFQDAMFRQLNPRSQAEITLADRIVTLSWRLKRIPQMETQMIDWHCKEDAPHAALMWGEARAFTNLSRYEGQLDRCLHRTYKKLDELQASRNAEHFATRTKEIIEVEVVREKNEHIYIQERQREAKRKEKAQKSFEKKVAEYHSKNTAEDNQSQASHLAQPRPALGDPANNGDPATPQLSVLENHSVSTKPTLAPPRERVGAGNSETVPSPKRQRRGEGAKTEAKSQPQEKKNQTNPPNLNQVQEEERLSGDPTDPTDPTEQILQSLPKPMLIQFIDEDDEDVKPQATSHMQHLPEGRPGML